MLSKIKIPMLATMVAIAGIGLICVTKYHSKPLEKDGVDLHIHLGGNSEIAHSEGNVLEEYDPNYYRNMLIVDVSGKNVKVKDHGQPERSLSLEEFKQEYSHTLSTHAMNLIDINV